MLNEGNQIHNFISSSGSGTVINYGSGSDFLTSYGSGSGSTRQKVTVPSVPVPVPVPVPQHWLRILSYPFHITRALRKKKSTIGPEFKDNFLVLIFLP
jgi:hypothetical protein